MDLAHPHRSLGMGATGDVLMALGSLRSPLSGRRIAARAGTSPSRTHSVLTELADVGVVHRTQAPPAVLYELNRSHALAGVVEQLLALRRRMRDQLVEALRQWDPAPLAAVVFGSTAKGTGGRDSDIDLLLLRPNDVAPDNDAWVEQIAELSAAVRECTGNALDVIDLDSSELAANERLLANVALNSDVLIGELGTQGGAVT